MTSTRLPGKVLRKAAGKTLLSHQIERLRRIQAVDEIVVATTTNSSDDILVTHCETLGIRTYRGSEHDVLARYYGAAKEARADIVVRVTSDCPLIDPDVSSRIVQFFVDNQERIDYVSNTIDRTYPRGLDTEVFPFRILETANIEAIEPYEREHVTPFIYCHPERFRIAQIKDDIDRNTQRWTVDTPEDFEFVHKVLETVYPEHPHFTMHDVLSILTANPDWLDINSHIEQKKLV
jgi:spore coat polysaccharide biosynthesis protein SpsF